MFYECIAITWKTSILQNPYLSTSGDVEPLPVTPKLIVVELTEATEVDAVEFLTNS